MTSSINNEKIQQYSHKLSQYYASFGSNKAIDAQKSLQMALESLVDSFDGVLVTHRKGIIGKINIFVKRTIRKLMRFLLKPYAEKIYLFQTKSLETVGKVLELLLEQATAYDSKLTEQATAYDIKIAERDAVIAQFSDMLSQHNHKLHLIEQAGFIFEADNSDEILSYSKSGEDAIILYILRHLHIDISKVKYLDLGASHAKSLSNSYALYRRGASGVLVEANPRLIPELKFFRNRDVIINKIVSDISGEMLQINISDNADGLSTLIDESAANVVESLDWVEFTKTELTTVTYEEIIDLYLGETPQILNIDIEGIELQILKSMNFSLNRPLIIIVETIPWRPHLVVGEKEEPCIRYLCEQGYVEYAFTGINSIMIDTKNPIITELYPRFAEDIVYGSNEI
ncbi:MAG: FkbM family methyltransferase [Clostridiales bacterium]|jgi:FkbM family methyltransferase|nr:FkbM family methyltransferase [Clostridiales bacterium]